MGQALPRVTIEDDGPAVDGVAYVAILRSQETTVRNGVSPAAAPSRFAGGAIAAKSPARFPLSVGGRPEACFGRFLPLDYTLSSDDFTKLIIECRRSEE